MTILSRSPRSRNDFKATGLIFTGFYLLTLASSALRPLFFAGMSLREALLSPETLCVIPFSILFMLSAFIPGLSWLQPATLLLSVPFSYFGDPDSMYGLGSFVLGVVMLFRLGFFSKSASLKVAGLFIYLIMGEVGAILIAKNQHVVKAFVPVLYTIAFLALLFVLYREKITVYLKEPKPAMSLAEAGLSRTESDYVRAMLLGKTIKEIAQESGKRDSTVRNTLSRAYRKVEVPDRAGLMAKLEKFDVTD